MLVLDTTIAVTVTTVSSFWYLLQVVRPISRVHSLLACSAVIALLYQLNFILKLIMLSKLFYFRLLPIRYCWHEAPHGVSTHHTWNLLSIDICLLAQEHFMSFYFPSPAIAHLLYFLFSIHWLFLFFFVVFGLGNGQFDSSVQFAHIISHTTGIASATIIPMSNIRNNIFAFHIFPRCTHIALLIFNIA